MDEDVAQGLNRIANLQGKTLYSLMNEIGTQAIEAYKQGFGLEDALRAKRVMESARRSRMILVNQDLWYFASSQATRASKSTWSKLVRKRAQWEANVLLEKGEPSGAPGGFAASMRRFVDDFVWDCSKTDLRNADESKALSLKLAFVPEMPLEHTQTLFKAFEGMFNVHGYVATDSSVEPGFLAASFKKVEGEVLAKTPAGEP